VSSGEGRHLSDEDLLLAYYGESTASDRERVAAHLSECEPCRALDRELREVLAAVETTPLAEPPSGFEREMWARIEPLLPVPRAQRPLWNLGLPRLAFAASVALLVVGAFALGRVWDRPPEEPPAPIAIDWASADRVLRAEVEDHFDRSERVLVELVNADYTISDGISGGRARAADLVSAGRLYRRSAQNIGDAEVGSLLEDLERVLVDVANGPVDREPDEIARLRERIDAQDLIFRLRVVKAELRETDGERVR
jgi:hypothetical protein